MLKFPWDDKRWPQVLPFFQSTLTKWQGEVDTTVHKRREDLKALLSNYTKCYKSLDELQDEFFSPQGPLVHMVEAVVNGVMHFPAGQACTTAYNNAVVKLTKKQAFVICSLSFFGLFETYHYPSMLYGPKLGCCIANYFVRMCKEAKNDASWFDKEIVIERRVLDKTVPEPAWEKSTKPIGGLHINSPKLGIEDIRDSYQINFADPYPGGTLPSAHGDIVQEEILFLIYPELFVTPLLVPRINSTEAIIVSGVTRTNKYKGYQWSFDFDGDFDVDSNDISIIFIDALPGGVSSVEAYIRELNKAYLGFSCDTYGKSIATGHWGCGAFGGNTELKALIQLLAAAEAERDLEYVPHSKSIEGFDETHMALREKGVTVGQLYEFLHQKIGPKCSPFSFKRRSYFEKVVRWLEEK